MSNFARQSGGGIQNIRVSSGRLSNCIFTGNSAGNGGAVCNGDGSSPEFRNCVLSRNSSVGYGGAMYNFIDSSPTLLNSTFSGNKGGDGVGGAMANDRNSNASLTNCILYGDKPGEIQLIDSAVVIAYSNVQHTHPGPWPGVGNLNTDPLFVDYRSGDYHLRSRSLCINAGDPNRTSEAGETDIDGEARAMGGRIDMGADEFCP